MADPLKTTRAVRPLWSQTRHYWLAKRMAKATGLDLCAAMDRAALSQADWAQMVTRCRGCGWRESCERWLDRAPDGSGAPRDIPQTCANAHRFAALKNVLEREDA